MLVAPVEQAGLSFGLGPLRRVETTCELLREPLQPFDRRMAARPDGWHQDGSAHAECEGGQRFELSHGLYHHEDECCGVPARRQSRALLRIG